MLISDDRVLLIVFRLLYQKMLLYLYGLYLGVIFNGQAWATSSIDDGDLHFGAYLI